MPQCRILVIDDDLPAALKMAKQIRELERAPAVQNLNITMVIEVSNSALWAWSALDGASDRWNIIFSDVMMPVEEQPDAKQTQRDGYTLWVTIGPKSVPSFQGGGFDLARNLSDWRHNRPELQLPKLVLMSSLLDKPKRRSVNTFASENREWFQYFDKAECPQHWRGDRVYLYRYALLQALINYQAKSWNDGQFYPVTSEWRSLRYDASQMAKKPRIRHVLVVGPTGSGKSVLARFLLNERGFKDPPIISAGMLDKEGLNARWHRGGLYIDQLERLSPSAHDPIYRELEEVSENSDGEQKLCVWSAKSIKGLKESATLSDSFISLLQTHSLEIDKLRIEDVQELAGAVCDQYAPGFTVDDAVYGALEAAEWPGNLRGIQIAVREAINRAREFGDSELRVDHFQLPNLKVGTSGHAIPSSAQTPPVSLHHDIAAGMTSSVPDMIGPDDWALKKQQIEAIQSELSTLEAVMKTAGGVHKVSSPKFIIDRKDKYPALARCNEDLLDVAIIDIKKPRLSRSFRSPKDLATHLFTNGDTGRFDTLKKKDAAKKPSQPHDGNRRQSAAKRGM